MLWQINRQTLFQVPTSVLQSRKLSQKTKENPKLKDVVTNETTKNIRTLPTKRTVLKTEALTWVKLQSKNDCGTGEKRQSHQFQQQKTSTIKKFKKQKKRLRRLCGIR